MILKASSNGCFFVFGLCYALAGGIAGILYPARIGLTRYASDQAAHAYSKRMALAGAIRETKRAGKSSTT